MYMYVTSWTNLDFYVGFFASFPLALSHKPSVFSSFPSLPFLSCAFLKLSSLMRCHDSPDLAPLFFLVSVHLHKSASNLSFTVFLSP